MSIIVNGIELTEVIYAGVNLDTVKVKKGAAEAVTVFEKITQLSTPQNVTADGTVVSWDEVENATSYEVLADGSEIGTVEKAPTGYDVTLSVTENISNIIVMINDTIQDDISDVGTKTYNNVNKIELTAGDADLHITNSTGSFINGTYYTKEFIITSNSSCSIRHGY